MAKYSIAEVEQLTGIQAHTLRVWERRYALIKAQRTKTKIRYYDDDQLKFLLNVSILLKNGYRVSAIDKMQSEEIVNVTKRLLTVKTTKIDEDIQGLTMSMLTLDETLFTRIYQGFLMRNGLKNTVVELLYPFLHHVGVLWGTNRAMPAQEHFITNLIRRKLFTAIDNLAEEGNEVPKMVLFLPEGDYHEIGLLLSYYLARVAGFKVYYLGQNVPSEDVISTMEMVKADYVMTVILIPRPEYEVQVRSICGGKAKVLVSGKLDKMDLENDSIVKLNTPSDFVNFLEGNLKYS